MTTTLTILIEPSGIGDRGQRYRVTFAGRVLLQSAREPLLEACRALVAHGVTGRLEMWRRGKDHYDMALDVERGARLTVAETAEAGPAFREWKPFTSQASENAFPAVTGRSRNGAFDFQVGRGRPENRPPAG